MSSSLAQSLVSRPLQPKVPATCYLCTLSPLRIFYLSRTMIPRRVRTRRTLPTHDITRSMDANIRMVPNDDLPDYNDAETRIITFHFDVDIGRVNPDGNTVTYSTVIVSLSPH